MPYVRIGLDPIHNGKRLFDLLCNLKNFGRERIIYSTLEQKYQEPSFYRILLAQLEMDLDKPHTFGKEKPWTQTGTSSRIVTERVYRGMRYTEPFNLTAELNKQMQFADYRLVPKGMTFLVNFIKANVPSILIEIFSIFELKVLITLLFIFR